MTEVLLRISVPHSTWDWARQVAYPAASVSPYVRPELSRKRISQTRCFATIADPAKHVIVQTALAVRAALGEEFGYPIGTGVEGKMVSALKMLGFDKVFDTDFSADLTIMEGGP